MATVRLTQTRCPECSASIAVSGDAPSLRCEYCGTTLTVERKRPPRDVTLTMPRTVYVPSGMPAVAKIALLAGLLPLMIAGTQLWPLLRVFIPVVGNQLPVECPINGRISIKDKTYSGPGPLIKAGVNCTIEIKSSKLDSDVIIEGGVNTRIEIDRSTLIAKKRAITSSVNTKLKVTGPSEIAGDKAALELGPNAEVHLANTVVRSAGVAIKADANLSLETEGGRLEGGTAAIQASGWTRQLDLDASTQVTGAKLAKVH